ncbi:MAG: 23S rRNA (adenine(1618)-N(6))-methyltransferase RlmF [Cyclobacteriaceae bacterium]
MSSNKTASKLHPRNKHRDGYDLDALQRVCPELTPFIKPSKSGHNTIDFSNPKAVKALNRSLLFHSFGLKYWDFPDNNLCPPIPGREDYIHYAADLLEEITGANPNNSQITCLDIGTGASCIYPMLGVQLYNWMFIASDIDRASISSSETIAQHNPSLEGKIDFRLQQNSNNIFKGVIHENEKITLTVCNPPFHASIEEAQKGTLRKIKNLTGGKSKKRTLNFSGRENELVYPGGELSFILKMIDESIHLSESTLLFTTLVSKESNLKPILQELRRIKVKGSWTVPMQTGNKSTRIVGWTFQSAKQRKAWIMQ